MNGKLGSAAVPATANTTIYTVPTSTCATFSILMCNRSAASVTVNLSVAPTGAPTTADYIEYGLVIPPSGIFERGGITASAGEQVVVYASSAAITCRVHGFEEVA